MEQNVNKKLFDSADAGVAFTLTSMLPYLLSFIVTLIFTFANKASGAGYTFTLLFTSQIAQFLIIFLLLKRKNNGLKPLNLNKFDYKYILIILGLSYGTIFSLGYLNKLFITAIESVGGSYNPIEMPLDTPLQFVLVLFVLGVLPPIFEECIFRGVILSGLSGMKTAYKVLLVGGLFALFHQNPAQTIHPFITGVTFALVTIKSGSTLPAIIMHIINNVFVIVATYFFPSVNFYNTFTLISGAVVFTVCFALLILSKQKQVEGGAYSLKDFFIFASFGLIINSILWVVALI